MDEFIIDPNFRMLEELQEANDPFWWFYQQGLERDSYE